MTSTAWSARAGAARALEAKGGILKRTVQRPMDMLGSGILLLLASPLFLVTALAIWLTDRGSVFYRQTRVGLHGRPFEMLKFRSMRTNNLPLDDVTEIREGHPLVTPVGRWLRRYKIDELPQLLNVFRGDMALIGPRPGLQEHLEKYDAFQWRRLNVLPGMTGWAQVNGGIELSWTQRIMLDIWYVEHRGFWLDVKIMARTVGVVLFGENKNPQALREATAYAAQETGVVETEPLLRPVPVAVGDHGTDGPDPSVAPVAAPDGDGRRRRLGRVVHLSSVHSVFDTRIFHKECKSLAMAGYDVTVIGLSSESGTSRDGVKIRPLPPPRSRRERMSRTIWNVYQAAAQENADIYHFHDPELMPVGVLLKMRGKRVVYDVHEEVSCGIRYKQWLPPLLRWPLSMAFRACEMTLVSSFDRVIAVTPSIASKYPAGKTRCVRNFPWSHEFRAIEGLPYEQRESIAVYVGVLSDRRGLREMSQAVELAAKQVPIKLVLAGRVTGSKAEFLPRADNELVECKGLLDHAKIPELLAQAKIGLFLMHPMPNKLDALPVKLFEYMAAGLPVVISDLPLWRQIVQSAECGMTVNPFDPSAVAEALVWLLRHPAEAAAMGRNGQRAIAEKYNWQCESQSLIATYAELQSA